MTTTHSSVAGQMLLRRRRKQRLNNKIRHAKAAITRAMKNGNSSEADQLRAMLVVQSTFLDIMAELNKRIG
jgi:hypothetical protein